MNRLIAKLMSVLVVAASLVASPYALANGPVTVLTNLQATAPGTPSATGWNFGGVSVVATTPPPVSGDAPYAFEGKYNAVGSAGEFGPYANFSVKSLNTESVYIDFWAKMPDAKEGFKFLKIFGIDNGSGAANTTVMADYTGANQGAIRLAEYGDGTTQSNDSQNAIFFNGLAVVGRAKGIATVLTPQMHSFSNWGIGWHHFRIHIKFNSGTTSANQVPNGEIYVEIDGQVYVDTTGLYNRNYLDLPINYIGFFGWAQTDPQAFDVWYDNIVISTGGFVSDPQPSAMSAAMN